MPQDTFYPLSAKIVGPIGTSVWSQVITLDNLYAVMVLTGTEDGQLGHQLLNFLEEESHNLVKRNLAEVSLLSERIKEQLPLKTHLSLVMALSVGKALYIVSVGGAAFLKRGEKVVKIIDGEERVSGFLEEGDLLILGSKQFFQTITQEVLLKSLDYFSPEEVAESLVPKISEDEENASCAALILRFTKKEEPEIEEPEIEEETEEEEESKVGQDTGSVVAPPVRSNFLNNIGQKFKSLKFNRPNLSPSLSLPTGGTGTKRKGTLLTVAFLLVVLLVASIFLGINKNRESEQSKQFEEIYQVASSKYEEGKGLVGLNDVLARNSLSTAQGKVEDLKNLPSPTHDQEKKIKDLEDKIKENLVVLSRVYKLGSLPLFWETGLVKPGSEGERLSIFEGQTAILDKNNRVVFLLLLETKAVTSFEAGVKSDPQLVGLHGADIYLFTKEGITDLNTKNKKTQTVIDKDGVSGDIADMVAYGGNLYILDKGASEDSKSGQIWKYMATETGFSPRRRYFATDIQPDLSLAESMAIDGSIWVLLTDQILKFTSGRPDSFTISGLEGDFGQPQVIFTDENSKNLYLLDSKNKKVLVLGKDGAYQAQYQAPEIGQARDLVVSEDQKKIFLLSGSKVYAIGLK